MIVNPISSKKPAKAKIIVTAPTGSVLTAQKLKPLLPDGYEELEYIKSDGNQYLDTGYIPNNNTELEMRINFTTDSAWSSPFGVRNRPSASSNDKAFYVERDFASSKKWLLWYGNKYTNPTVTNATGKYYVSIKKNVWQFGEISYTFPSATFTSTKPMLIFAKNQSGAETQVQGYSIMECEFYKISENGVLLHDAHPARRKSDNAIGLYDLVNDTFTASATSTPFIAGPAKPHGYSMNQHQCLPLPQIPSP